MHPRRVMSALEGRLRRLLAGLNGFWHSSPAAFGLRSAWVRWRNTMSGGPTPIAVLLVTDVAADTSELQYVAILGHATLLNKRLGAVTQICELNDTLKLD